MDLNRLGKMSISKIKRTDSDIEFIELGSPLDMFTAVGNGTKRGFPKGSIIDISGGPDSGKTTLVMHIVSLFQKKQLMTAWIDADYSFYSQRAESLGLEPNRLMICQPDYGEQAIEVIKTLADTKAIDLIVIDSIAGMVPYWEIMGEMGNANYAAQYNMIAKGIPNIMMSLRTSGTIVLIVNRLSHKLNREVTTIGDRILDAYASMRFTVARDSLIKRGIDVTGIKLDVNLIKTSKIPTEITSIRLPIYYEE